MRRAAFCTLGCKVNQYETEIMQQHFTENGFTVVSDKELAEVYVVNSCTVTAEGDKKSRQILRRLRRQNPLAVIALAGCYPQAFPEEAALLVEADIVAGAKDRARLLEDVNRLLAARDAGDAERLMAVSPHTADEPFEPMAADRLSDHTRAFVKIEDGCDRWCSYCIIPKARGPIRSKPLEDIERELAVLAGNGYKEIVLSGINLSSYGKETGSFLLSEAVRRACAVPGIERVRLGSLEPELLTGDDLDILSDLDKFCPQFHLSLQSGCEETLRRMNRRYTPDEYWWIADLIRARFEDRPGGASITTDVMVGFPGETEEEFEQSLDFCRRIGFAKAHVFAYSRRVGTRAAEMPDQIPGNVKEARSHRMIAALDICRNEFLRTQAGAVQEVLFESCAEGGRYVGYTMNYSPVSVEYGDDIRGQILPVAIEALDEAGGLCMGAVKLPAAAEK